MKNHFNDPREDYVGWRTQCASCRCEIHLTVSHYPHGPNEVRYCAVCGSDIIGGKDGTITKLHNTPQS